MSLEELSNIRITSVSRREEQLSDAPASVFVITGDDVRRSGAASLVEALRLAPNLQVNMVNSGGYVVTARGFANNDGNKLLVLIDGRSVYSPLFSGVFWDAQSVMLDDIERIEVISGPGGTLWGTNAVNGVINVITRSASGTQGGLAAAGAGNLRADAAFRYGGKTSSDISYRVYGMHFNVQDTETAAGTHVDDAWHKTQLGFRTDWERGDDAFTVQGDAYRAGKGQPAPGSITISGVHMDLKDVSLRGANVLARWTRALDGGGEMMAQAYYDRVERDNPPTFAEVLDIADVQAQWRLAAIGRHTVTVGGEYRFARDRLTNSTYIAFLPDRQDLSWSSLYAQDDVRLSAATTLTAGVRMERNRYTGNEFLPNLRLSWKATPDLLLWGAASRTVRAPSRLDRDVFIPAKPPYLLAGGPGFESEVARVFELGARGQAGKISYAVNAYRALYDDLHTQELAPSRRSVFYGNGMMASTRGVEAWASYQPHQRWRLTAAFTTMHERFWLKPGSIDTANSVKKAGHDPRNTLHLRSSWQIDDRLDLDLNWRRIGRLANPDVPAYRVLDARLGWRLSKALELSLGGTGLGGSHGEFGDVATRTEIEPSVYLKLLSRF
ncbi:TonB-dependent receptor plug domain-containing protein [Massilia endophytica]|uniref:TonB-dependent receptor plug domain-containing protein n=1 Tax=Massilia endophytica TaxID=2899220 RepID=UPI001E32C2AF|nr:TonB-dependent receptor [Massilia endophytica]UGQ48325.1 TonB-dependent receptor [Massilia endophytica]